MAAATVAPLLTLKRAAKKAEDLARFSRAVELYERALAAAELALPRDSLVIASLLNELVTTHLAVWQANPASSPAAADGIKLTTMRSLLLLHARWQAGTLFAPTAEEEAYLVENEHPCLPAPQMCGAFFYMRVAHCAGQLSPAHAESCLQGVYGALRAVLEMDARGMLERNSRTGEAWPAGGASAGSLTVHSHLKFTVHRLVTAALCREAGMLFRMRATCGLSAAEETALCQLAERIKVECDSTEQETWRRMDACTESRQQTAAADAARHGLRRCALPSCDAQEPHPKLFKLCGRCSGAAYCCKQHQTEDWKRHKREDGCKPAA